MHIQQCPAQNHLLAALPASDLERIESRLEMVMLPRGRVLCEAGARLQHAYFPTTSMVSLFYMLNDGSTSEIAAVGNEGVLGVQLFTGGKTSTTQAVVESAGFAYRMSADAFLQEFNRAGPFQRLLLLYTQALMSQISQIAVCNRHHSVEQQLCRCLLLSRDRLPTDELPLTQELIANMLGVRRESVTEAAGRLAKAGVIHYSRGRIQILDRPALEKRSCECYEVVSKEFGRLLPDERHNRAPRATITL